MFNVFTTPIAWAALLSLIVLEIILSIDNMHLIWAASEKLSDKSQKKARRVGVFFAWLVRIVLLFGIMYLMTMKKPFLVFDNSWASGGINIQAIILFAGGFFLLFKGSREIREKIEHKGHDEAEVIKARSNSFTKVMVQVILINAVFSLDSILFALGMTQGITTNMDDALIIMVTALTLSLILMVLFTRPIEDFVQKHPSFQVIGLSFLMLIGFLLIAEAAHISHITVFDIATGIIPKGYLYFALIFSFVVVLIDLRIKKNTKSEIRKVADNFGDEPREI